MLPYRIIRVLLLPGETVDNYTFTWTSETVLDADFNPTAAPSHISNEGIETANDPVAEWLPELGRFPSTAGRYLGTGHLHGYSIASFAVFPLIVEQNTLIFLEDLTLELNTKTAENGQEVANRIRFREGFHGKVQSQLASMVLNPGQTVGYHVGQTRVVKKSGGFQPTSFPSLEGSPVDYVIITNDSLMAAYQTLADWKTTKGVPTVIRSTEWVEANYRNGSDLQETIRNFIKDAYAKWGITYVLLGGDTEQVPVRLAHSCFYGGGRDLPVDLYYACLDGDWNADHDQVFGEFPSGVGGCIGGDDDQVDLYAEVYVGRLPTRSTADVNLLTTKIISYESPTDPQYANRIMLLAEVLFPVDWDPGETINLNGADLAQFTYRTILSDPNLDV
ncbi:MAG: hypothetical protein KAT30_05945, partial [Candidatus Krumholzibacteria bacterium]|nr:hypothetical protein [Candidatus Krumholzibacteria bacterium]